MEGIKGVDPNSAVEQIAKWATCRFSCPTIFLNLNVAENMSGQNLNQTLNIPPVGGSTQMDLEKCMEIAAGNRWLSLDDSLDPVAVKTVLDTCYQLLRAEAERA